jgi:anthranilate phosphoribosyltransferase
VTPLSIPHLLQKLFIRQDLADDEVGPFFDAVMKGQCGDAEMAAVLIGLRMKGETSGEIAAAAQAMRDHMIGWDPGEGEVLDTCGTGGDGSSSFNISTATAFVLAGLGVRVVKHGNRSISSRSGSADVLAELGVPLESDPDLLRRCLAETNLAFCFAPLFHPAMKHVAAVRRTLGVPTIFNCLGPLANPARAKRQLLGVGRPELLELMAGALAKLGTTLSFLVCSHDGLDEVSLSAPTRVCIVSEGLIQRHDWTPDDFDLEPVDMRDVAVADAKESAAIIRHLLLGVEGPAQRLVLANAAAGLLTAQKADTLRQGVDLAREALRDGRALHVLRQLQTIKGNTP